MGVLGALNDNGIMYSVHRNPVIVMSACKKHRVRTRHPSEAPSVGAGSTIYLPDVAAR